MIINGKDLLDLAPIENMRKTKINDKGVSYGLTECGYDIRLKQTIVFERESFGPSFHSIDGGRMIEGHFALGSSIEKFNMPSILMGRVLNKSTWARKGLDASLTTNIEPGWKGHLTIELVFHKYGRLVIPAGSGICQIIFEGLTCPAHYKGKYQDQKDEPVDGYFA